MTRDKAKETIANYCGATITKLYKDKSYCNLEGFIFLLSLIVTGGSAKKKKTGFYYYSTASLRKEKEVVGLWLQDKLRNNGFLEEEFQVRKKSGKKEEGKEGEEGHVADFYLDIDWEELSDKDLTKIKNLYERLKTFQKKDKAWPNDVNERNRQIKLYNEKHLSDVRNYIAQRLKGLKESVSKEEQPSTPNQDSNIQPIMTPIQSLLKANLNIILTGAPGTGKTFTAKEVAKAMVGAIVPEDATEEEKSAAKTAEEKRIQSVQFHPGYDYSDFVIGMKPVLVSNKGKEVFEDESGRLYTTANNKKDGKPTDFSGTTSVSFVWRDGIFKQFADKAKNDLRNNYVFLIDEINRADLSRVFGELFSLLEEEYRYSKNADGTEVNAKGITLPNGKNFVIPINLYIIGTMNDIDRSVESMDFALRRRFAWKEVTAEESKKIIKEKTIVESDKTNLWKAMDALNDMIAPQPQSVANEGTGTKDKTEKTLDLRLGSEYQLGGAIFAKLEKYVGKDDDGKPKAADAKGYKELWDNHIENILREYLRGRSNQAEALEALKKAYNTALPNELREEKYRQAEKQDDGGDKDGTGGNND